MPALAAIPWLGTAIAGGAAAGATIYGANKMSHANEQAAQTEGTYNARALAAQEEQNRYDRQQQQDQIARDLENQTYQRSKFDEEQKYERGQSEASIGRQLEQQGYQRGQRSDYLTRLEPYRAASSGSLARLDTLLRPEQVMSRPAAPQAGGPGGNGVLLKAPNGKTAMVPPDQVDHYLKLGAVQVS